MNWELVIGASAIIPLLKAGIRLALPVALAAVGETFSQRAGVLNLGVEGSMIMGAVAGFLATYWSGNLAVGMVMGSLAGLAMGAVMAGLAIWIRTDQVITGISLVLVGEGITVFAYQQAFGVGSQPPVLPPLDTITIPVLGRIPGVGPVLFQQTWLFYVAILLVALVSWMLFRTRTGLFVRAAGERPDALEAAGVSVRWTRTIGLLVSGSMAGFGGALVAIELGRFAPFITAGRGWIAIALVILGRWNPMLVFLGALTFGLLNALQLRIQSASGGSETALPFEFFQALPYLATLVVLVLATALGRRDAQPAALARPYDPAERSG